MCSPLTKGMFLAKDCNMDLQELGDSQAVSSPFTWSLVFPVGLPSGSLQSFDAFQSDSVQIRFLIFEALLVSRAGGAANWKSFIAKSEDGPGPVHWHQYLHICCLKLLLWRQVPTEPQEEGERFTLQDGHLATLRIQDWSLGNCSLYTWWHGALQTITKSVSKRWQQPRVSTFRELALGSWICLLSGIGRGTEAQLNPDIPETVWRQDWWYRGPGLVFGEDGDDDEEPIIMGRGTAVGIETEQIEGAMVNWVKGGPYRGLVLRCAKSIMQI